jgi:dTDP-4-amino-4,6-dideoxygalactose transaminase
VILHTGAEPVLADIGADGNIDPASVEARITERTRAIMPVHLSGLPCEMDALWSLAKKHGLRVIEDSAHATGSRYRGNPIGAGNPSNGHFSDAAVFSFYATKNMTTGEGGMVTTHDEQMADSLKTLCLHGVSKNAWNRYSDRGSWYYQVLRPGFKYNLSDIQSAIGIHQLRKLESFTEARQRLAARYSMAFDGVEEFEVPPEKAHCRHSWHLYMLRLNLSRLNIDRDQFIVELKNRGIGTSVHFIPIPLHPFFAAYANRPENACPRALELYPRLISLPMYPSMTDAELQYVVAVTKDVASRARKKKSVFISRKQNREVIPAVGPQ